MDEAKILQQWVEARDAEYGQALRFILSSGARIDEMLHLRADKIFAEEKRVELIGKGGRVRRIQVLQGEVLGELDFSCRFVYLNGTDRPNWKDGLERIVRQGCDALSIRRRGAHGFRATAAGEFITIKRALGFTEVEARHELAQWLGHNPYRTEVTYAYAPKRRGMYRPWSNHKAQLNVSIDLLAAVPDDRTGRAGAGQHRAVGFVRLR